MQREYSEPNQISERDKESNILIHIGNDKATGIYQIIGEGIFHILLNKKR